MTEALPSPFLTRRKGAAAARRVRTRAVTSWNGESARPIEIVAPDRYCTALLLEYAAPLFPAEFVSGSEWVVRLHPPAGGGWVLELLSLVERWLESAPLPCAKVLYGGRSYLIRAANDAPFAAASAQAGAATSTGPEELRAAPC